MSKQQIYIFIGVIIAVLLGVGLYHRNNASENSSIGIVCPQDALVCADGTALGRTGPDCTFPECPTIE